GNYNGDQKAVLDPDLRLSVRTAQQLAQHQAGEDRRDANQSNHEHDREELERQIVDHWRHVRTSTAVSPVTLRVIPAIDETLPLAVDPGQRPRGDTRHFDLQA